MRAAPLGASEAMKSASALALRFCAVVRNVAICVELSVVAPRVSLRVLGRWRVVP